MADTKLIKSAGEHSVAAAMSGHGWGVALTRDGLEHADVLAVHSDSRRTVEVQVKTASHMPRPNWRLNLKAQEPARTDHEWFVLVALGASPSTAPRSFILPRDHVAAAAWINHSGAVSSTRGRRVLCSRSRGRGRTGGGRGSCDARRD